MTVYKTSYIPCTMDGYYERMFVEPTSSPPELGETLAPVKLTIGNTQIVFSLDDLYLALSEE